MTKQDIVKKLFDEGHIDFEQAAILLEGDIKPILPDWTKEWHEDNYKSKYDPEQFRVTCEGTGTFNSNPMYKLKRKGFVNPIVEGLNFKEIHDWAKTNMSIGEYWICRARRRLLKIS